MIALLLALGVLTAAPAESGDIIADAEQTVEITKVQPGTSAGSAIPLGAYQWERPFDPSDRAPYAFDFSALLPTDGKIASIERLTMLAAGAAVGVQIDQQDPRRPIIGTDGKAIQLWFLVAAGQQWADAFAGEGVKVGVAALIRTDSVPYREYERTAVLTVRQQ